MCNQVGFESQGAVEHCLWGGVLVQLAIYWLGGKLAHVCKATQGLNHMISMCSEVALETTISTLGYESLSQG